MRHRIALVAVVSALVPAGAWLAIGDAPSGAAPAPCAPGPGSPTTTTSTTTSTPTDSTVAATDATTTTSDVTTTAPPAPIECPPEPTTTTSAVGAPPTEVTPTSAPMPDVPAETAEPAAPTTSAPLAPPTAEGASAAPVDDVETAAVEAAPEPPAGRPLAVTGLVDTGELRAITFPVAGPITYGNDFGACRDGCDRQHRGNDLIGDRLQPLLAMRDGVVDRLLDHPTAGHGVVVRDAEGWEYHLYHVNNDAPGTDDGADDGRWRFPPGVVPGAPVAAGQVVAWMGDSGNSEGSVPHAHVEIHAPDGRAINPYWSLRLAQHDVNCAIGDRDPAARAVPPAPTTLDAAWVELLGPDLPGSWWGPLELTGGRPGSGRLAASMWIDPTGWVPADAAALVVGDRRYDGPCDRAPDIGPPSDTRLDAVLATIRTMESGGDYRAEARGSSASGAYQFVDGTWDGYGGYARAKDAPPSVQDAKAASLASSILARHRGDVSTVPVTWYLGHLPTAGEWDVVPAVGANTLTPREYQRRWLAAHATVRGAPATSIGWTPIATTSTCRPAVVQVSGAVGAGTVLTLTSRFTLDANGRPGVGPSDPCSPAELPEPPASPAPAGRGAR